MTALEADGEFAAEAEPATAGEPEDPTTPVPTGGAALADDQRSRHQRGSNLIRYRRRNLSRR